MDKKQHTEPQISKGEIPGYYIIPCKGLRIPNIGYIISGDRLLVCVETFDDFDQSWLAEKIDRLKQLEIRNLEKDFPDLKPNLEMFKMKSRYIFVPFTHEVPLEQ